MWSEIRDGIGAYEASRAFSGKVTLEEFVLAVIIGIMTHSLWAGGDRIFRDRFLVGGSCDWQDSDFCFFGYLWSCSLFSFKPALCTVRTVLRVCRVDFFGIHGRAYRDSGLLRKRAIF